VATGPVSVRVRSAEGEAVVDEGRVDHGREFGEVEQVVEIAEVAVTAAHAVARTVLVQYEHLTRTEPALHTRPQRLRVNAVLAFY